MSFFSLKRTVFSFILLGHLCSHLPAQTKSTEIRNSDYFGVIGKPDKREAIAKEEPAFWDILLENMNDGHYPLDSLKDFYRQHPVEAEKYIKYYLISKEIFPNEDAIELIKCLNPSIKGLREIKFYTPLYMPLFADLKKPYKKRLEKEQELLSQFDESARKEFNIQLETCQKTITIFVRADVQFENQDDRIRVDTLLSSLQQILYSYSNTKLTKGTFTFMTREVNVLNKLLNKFLTEKRVHSKDLDVLLSIRENMISSSSSDTGFLREDDSEIQSVSSHFWPANQASVSGGKELYDYGENITPPTYYSGEPSSVKICQIYAKKASPNGSPVLIDLPLQYFYCYQTKGEATFRCHSSSESCSGFIEGPDLISANGLNIVPGSYVFRFRDRVTSEMYFRCYSKEMFELIFQSTSGSKKKRFKLIFNPSSTNCQEYLPKYLK